MADLRYSADDIRAMLNEAADDIDAFVGGLPDEGARDALNLMVNIIGTRLDHPGQRVEDVISANYDAEPDEVRGWIDA